MLATIGPVIDSVAITELGAELIGHREQIAANPIADPHAVVGAEKAAKDPADTAAPAVAIVVDSPAVEFRVERTALAIIIVVVPASAAAVGKTNVLAKVAKPHLEVAALLGSQSVAGILRLETGQLTKLESQILRFAPGDR